jgi:hypothetical protein
MQLTGFPLKKATTASPVRAGLLAHGMDIINYKLLTNYSIVFMGL